MNKNNQTLKSISDKVEDHPIWKEVSDLAELYARAEEMPKDEEWRTASKLKQVSIDLLFYAAQAMGSAGVSSASYEWGNARKYAAALRAGYRFAGRQKFIELEPSTMVQLDRLIQQIDTELQKEAEKTNKREADDLRPWLKKYEIWKKLNAESKHE